MNAPNHYKVLDAFRGLCACFVAIFHFRVNVNSPIANTDFIQNSYLCVDFFFVLSGFVIFANYYDRLKNKQNFLDFMLLRVGRLYPLHIAVFLLIIFTELAQVAIPFLSSFAEYPPFQGPDTNIKDMLPNILLAHSFGLTERLAFNGPSWSISAEFWSYALFGLCVCLFKKYLKIMLPAVFLISGIFLYTEGLYLKTTYTFGLIRCFYSFSLGALLWLIYDATKDRIGNHDKLQKKFLWSVTEAILIGIFIWMVSVYGAAPVSMVMPLLFCLIIYVFSFEAGVLSGILKQKAFVFVGALSYSIYMIHTYFAGKLELTLKLISPYLPFNILSKENGETLLGETPFQGDMIVLFYLFSLIIVSYISYALIEVPARDFVKRYVKKRRKPN